MLESGHSLTSDLFLLNGGAAGAGGGFMEMMPMLVIMFLIFYFLLIRPQNKERKQQETMRSQLKKGDKVLTQGGVLGTVHGVKDTEVVLDFGSNTRIPFVKDAIIRVVSSKGDAGKGESDSKASDPKAAEAQG